ncbi:AAA family ATPase [Nocardia sp. NPDC058518]|uniref:AAA family ATPase n=1 Tax=Nocardia sp. NPDC058518 TaxID=3346534 RepID=UPI00365228B9
MSAWPIYRGSGEPHNGIANLPDPPNWRQFDGETGTHRRLGDREHQRTPTKDEIDIINAALFLRRPLLITGKPGVGKSTVAYEVAEELGLGEVLRWPITSRTRLRDGLYHYDPIGRLREEKHRTAADSDQADDIGRHIRLGPLGTALLPSDKPRVLLIDEIDKSDIDLPNDLLNVFEEGEFEIDELARLPENVTEVRVRTADPEAALVPIHRGRVRCSAFPVIVLTSNGEREFPTPFLRRCLRFVLQPPDRTQLTEILTAQLGSAASAAADELISNFLASRTTDEVTTDQLLNAVYLTTSAGTERPLDDIVQAVMKPLNQL